LLGGNCRVRSYNKLTAEGNFKLEKAKGKNPNPFFIVPNIKKPLISSEAKIKPVGLKKSYLYDFQTQEGKTYILKELE
jgi:alpha-L-fucosidase 2